MKEQLLPNRNITTGDQGAADMRRIRDIKDRIRDWSDSYVLKIYREFTAPGWREAAEEILKERGKMPKTTLTREQMSPKEKPLKAKKWKWKKKKKYGTPEEREARSTAWKLDRELDNKLRNTP
jgi:hypothetical protein